MFNSKGKIFSMLSTQDKRNRRKDRSRAKLKSVAKGALRLSVYRSSKHIYAQIIDDANDKTLVSASSLEKELKLKNGGNKEAAQTVGKLIAERAAKEKITAVVFDRSGLLFHGRVKALADAAREAGLKF